MCHNNWGKGKLMKIDDGNISPKNSNSEKIIDAKWTFGGYDRGGSNFVVV